ncbi:MAG: AAA family ATPase [Candidatus Thermofonsia Clade 1 bacterium]|uniref:AAA family ATPase n=1 Tax=Candidatus Thermofonsia Clade 1 bacterium TaxID=2364210 RepID=A0A2M8P0Z3_9CHLR|nr:MAG: AAA family ATPase [Candidatus Thermofonsia Clade 1 bacterium]
MRAIQTIAERLIENVSRVIIGKRNEIRLTVIGLLCQGHVLLEDVPGVGKTMLAKALARSLGCTFSRIQFTPDMLPSDVTGVSIFNQQTREFEFRAGPIFAQVVLADEINRATPKTQAALLEAMEERQVTVDGVTYQVEQPFIVLATQNPIEYEGTFPLPEAQLDRFLLRLRLGYPTPQEEMAMLDAQQLRHPLTTIGQVVSAEELLNAQKLVRNIVVNDDVKRYIIEIVTATRHHPDIYLGASPRGALALYRTAQARAAIAGRDHVIPDDVKALAEATLAHRVIVGPTARLREVTSRVIIQNLLANLPVPGASPIRV